MGVNIIKIYTCVKLAKINFKVALKPGMVVYSCNPSSWEIEAEDQEFKVIHSYMVNSRMLWL